MLRKFGDQSGYSLIEMSIVMLLLVLFSLGIFLLAAASTTTYESLVEQKNTSEDLRIASSYLVTKIRQNDRLSGVSIDRVTFDQKDALIIKEAIEEETYVTWIYVSEGVLREVTILEGVSPSDDLSFEIANIDKLELNGKENKLTIRLNKGETVLPDILVTLKTDIETIE